MFRSGGSCHACRDCSIGIVRSGGVIVGLTEVPKCRAARESANEDAALVRAVATGESGHCPLVATRTFLEGWCRCTAGPTLQSAATKRSGIAALRVTGR